MKLKLSVCMYQCSLASHTLKMKTEGLVQYGYHTRSSGMCGMFVRKHFKLYSLTCQIVK